MRMAIIICLNFSSLLESCYLSWVRLACHRKWLVPTQTSIFPITFPRITTSMLSNACYAQGYSLGKSCTKSISNEPMPNGMRSFGRNILNMPKTLTISMFQWVPIKNTKTNWKKVCLKFPFLIRKNSPRKKRSYLREALSGSRYSWVERPHTNNHCRVRKS